MFLSQVNLPGHVTNVLCCADRLKKRKVLMEGSEAYFDINESKSSSFLIHITKSEARNDELREVIAFV